ncbi:hypothetical protein AX14_002015 [Amanita brunnescens Koide BX004]|nr:hypothetical protein AX14_002015 [Amanita brunnescens Koide BX004]
MQQLSSLQYDDFDDELGAVQHDGLDDDNSNNSIWEMDSVGLHGPQDDENCSTELDGIDPHDFWDDYFTGGVYERDEGWDVEDAWEGAGDTSEGADAREDPDDVVELLLTSHSMGSSSKENNQPPTQVTLSTQPPVMEEYEIEYFPGEEAATPMETPTTSESVFTKYQQQLNNNNVYAPFASKLDWELTKWAKLHGPSSSAFNELLQIDGIADDLSYKNAQELNTLIDQKLPCRPSFHCHNIRIGAIYGNPEFAAHLIHKPERHFRRSGGERVRVFHDMHTGSWWWKVQEVLEGCRPGASVIPVIVSSDSTQVTQFGNKMAYPPLVDAGIHGVAMSDGLGTVRRVHPLLAIYIGDYPEQVTVTGIKTGQCPKCDVPNKELGNEQFQSKARDIHAVLGALHKFSTGNYREFFDACKVAGIKPIAMPFWLPLPFVDIFQSITPDALHQLLQGILKHLISWLIKAYGSEEINVCFQRLVPNHHIRVFTGGISGLSCVTGKEHGQVARGILGIIADLNIPGGYDAAHFIRAVHALLDFKYLADLKLISARHLTLMKEALNRFHENKQIFIDLGIRKDFNIPKLHSCLHYVELIRRFGTTDNYDTQYTERLHIELAKDAYCASNRWDELPQMTRWLERQEQVHDYAGYIAWRCNNPTPKPSPNLLLPAYQYIKMTRFPTIQSVSIADVITNYGAEFFYAVFARFVVLWRNGQITRACLEQEILDVHIPFISISAHHHIRYRDNNCDLTTVDSIHI